MVSSSFFGAADLRSDYQNSTEIEKNTKSKIFFGLQPQEYLRSNRDKHMGTTLARHFLKGGPYINLSDIVTV